jgi:hypothetical protein
VESLGKFGKEGDGFVLFERLVEKYPSVHLIFLGDAFKDKSMPAFCSSSGYTVRYPRSNGPAQDWLITRRLLPAEVPIMILNCEEDQVTQIRAILYVNVYPEAVIFTRSVPLYTATMRVLDEIGYLTVWTKDHLWLFKKSFI